MNKKNRLAFFLAGLMMASQAYSQQKSIHNLDSVIYSADARIRTDPRNFIKNVESFTVYSKDRVIFENYYNRTSRDSLHIIQSQTKSIVSLLMGIAIDKGLVLSENEKIAQFFPGYFQANDSLKMRIEIKDVLTMSTGMAWEEMIPFDDPKNDNRNMFNSGDWLDYALSRPMAGKPFTEFKYNSGCPMIIAGIIQKASGMPLDEFARQYLFGPLGISEFEWMKDSTGFFHAGGGLFLKPSDVVKIGALVLNKGKWGDVRVVSESWINKAVQPYFLTPLGGYSYGYFWWIKDLGIEGEKTTRVTSAQGAGGQYMYIFHEYGLVVSFTERNYGTPLAGPLIINTYFLHAMK